MYADLDRPPLRAQALRRALTRPPSLWREVSVLAETGSTNQVVAARARAGAGEGVVVAAEWQHAGRGRLERRWTSPPRAGLAVSVLLRPAPVPPARWGWLPLLAGVALAESVTAVAGLPDGVGAALKWPNDLLVAGRKAAGILAEVVGEAVVVGIGLNVTNREGELPPGVDATSLALAGAAVTDRDTLLRGLLRALAGRYESWRDAAGDPAAADLLAAYRDRCATIGQAVTVGLPGGEVIAGTARAVDAAGRLVVAGPAGERALAAGDVVHVRPIGELRSSS